MKQLTHWIPEGWRETLANLRDDIYDVAERWLPRRHHREATQNGTVLVRSSEPMDVMETFWAPSRLFASSPVIDVDETDDEVVVTAELPGLDPDDFVVEITGERMVIRGEKKHQASHTRRGYTYSERRYGAFARALQLPCEVDVDKAKARYNRGILRVVLPKTEHAKATRVKIQAQG
jgi:HSP20 family protein